jgi:hypothetical protein
MTKDEIPFIIGLFVALFLSLSLWLHLIFIVPIGREND